MLTTNQKGLIAETAIIHECAKLGIPVARPLDDERYDLIFDLRSGLLRVQCKYAAQIGDVVVIRCRRARRGPAGQIHRPYEPGEIDAIAAYCPATAKCYLLPLELSVRRATVDLRLSATRNNQTQGVRWARDYELGARIRLLQGP